MPLTRLLSLSAGSITIAFKKLTEVCRESALQTCGSYPRLCNSISDRCRWRIWTAFLFLAFGAYRLFQPQPISLMKRAILDLFVVDGRAFPIWAPDQSAWSLLALMLEGEGPVLVLADPCWAKTARQFEHGEISQHGCQGGGRCYRKICCANPDEDPRHPKFADDPRITRVGKLLAPNQLR